MLKFALREVGRKTGVQEGRRRREIRRRGQRKNVVIDSISRDGR